MTPADQQLVADLLEAITRRLTAPGDNRGNPRRDVVTTCAAITGLGCDAAVIGRFTALLNDTAGGDSGFAHTGEAVHDGYAPHSHEARPDHKGVRKHMGGGA